MPRERPDIGTKRPRQPAPRRAEFDVADAKEKAKEVTKKDARDAFEATIEEVERRGRKVADAVDRANRRQRRIEELEAKLQARGDLIRVELQPGGEAMLLPPGTKPGDLYDDGRGNVYKLTDDLDFVQVGGG